MVNLTVIFSWTHGCMNIVFVTMTTMMFPNSVNENNLLPYSSHACINKPFLAINTAKCRTGNLIWEVNQFSHYYCSRRLFRMAIILLSSTNILRWKFLRIYVVVKISLHHHASHFCSIFTKSKQCLVLVRQAEILSWSTSKRPWSSMCTWTINN